MMLNGWDALEIGKDIPKISVGHRSEEQPGHGRAERSDARDLARPDRLDERMTPTTARSS
jgi:hypothetical protein